MRLPLIHRGNVGYAGREHDNPMRRHAVPLNGDATKSVRQCHDEIRAAQDVALHVALEVRRCSRAARGSALERPRTLKVDDQGSSP